MPESDLYPPVNDYLEQRYREILKPRYGELRSISAITATSGGGTFDGKWTRPDLAMAALWRFEFGLSWTMDLHSFEVKTENGCDNVSVHEALSHTVMAHYSYLTWHNPSWDEKKGNCRAIHERCAQHGVGLITFGDPANSSTYHIRLRSIRHTPNGEAIDEFIETRFPQAERDLLRKWVQELR
jgi:hypothetical protein